MGCGVGASGTVDWDRGELARLAIEPAVLARGRPDIDRDVGMLEPLEVLEILGCDGGRVGELGGESKGIAGGRFRLSFEGVGDGAGDA